MRILGLFFIILFISIPVANAKRVALVIGNDDYLNVDKLLKAVNDAKAVAAVARELGFQVIEQNNTDRRRMDDRLNKLSETIESGDEVLFYFAGHGISVKGQNYLLPIDIPEIKPGQERSVTKEAFSENEIITLLQERGAKVSILIIDACRNNPFPKQGTRSVGRSVGLGERTNPPLNTFVMYSAGIGQQALDRLSETDKDPNSVFTRKLLPLLKTPGLSHVQMAKRLQIEVEQLALTTSDRHKQFPAFYDQVRGNIYLLPGDGNGVPKQITKPKLSSDEVLWETVNGSQKKSDYEFYLGKFPNGKFAPVAELKIRQLKEQTEKKKILAKPKVSSVPSRLILTSNGIGPFRSDSAFDLQAIRKALPNYQVKLEMESGEGEQYPVVTVTKRSGKKVLEVEGNLDGKIRSLEVWSTEILDSNGMRVGMKFADLPKNSVSTCYSGAEGYYNWSACELKYITKIQYWFNKPPTKQGFPPDNARIVKLRWLP